MSYLYGDSTPTELRSNFLEFLRDAVDFAVFVLEADARIKNGKVRIQRNTDAMEAELGRLEQFIGVVTRSIREAEKGTTDSPTAACATYLEKLVSDSERASVNAMRARLAQYIASVDAEEAESRAACFKALETLLVPHVPPDASTVTRLVLVQPGRYEATLDGRSTFGLAWTFALAIPDGTMWASPIRVERIAQNLEIRAPQLSGWISKEVKIRPQKLDRHVVTELVLEDDVVRMKLRAEPGIESGFDFSADLAAKTVQASRVGTAENDASVGPFDVVAEDAALIIDLAEKLRAGTADVTRRELTAAKFGDGDFRAVPTFIDVVERLVAMIAPITKEIAKRSLKPSELVLRRMLGNGRREEVFVEKATLREKYEPLSPPLREFFAPLGFDPPAAPQPPARETPRAADEPAARAELPRSQRPPPAPSDPPASSATPPPPPSLDLTSLDLASHAAPEPYGPAPSAPPDSGPAVEVILTPEPISLPPSSIQPAQSSAPPAAPPLPPPPESSQNPIAKLDKEATKNVELIAALKRIASLSRGGQIDQAYREYETLFSSAAFADYKPEEQRQALRLMVLAKSPPPKNDVVIDAHRAALTRLEVLVRALGEPIDLEMLGAAHAMCDDPRAANAAFVRALEIERARDPSSSLIASLMSRVASL
jgi:hypothetical protein